MNVPLLVDRLPQSKIIYLKQKKNKNNVRPTAWLKKFDNQYIYKKNGKNEICNPSTKHNNARARRG